ncbi:unnamed protein product, partial [Ectocarpus fasciculatus]
ALEWKSQILPLKPDNMVVLKSPISAKKAAQQLMNGSCILWEGDYHAGRAFLALISKKILKDPARPGNDLKEIFKQDRKKQAMRGQVLSRFVVRVQRGHSLAHLKRAPEIHDGLQAAYGNSGDGYLIPMREILGAIGSWEWTKKGVYIPILDDKIFPHFGVFCPTVRNEYVELLSAVPISENAKVAYDVGVGTGVLSAILIKRGVGYVVGTDISERALACADQNLTRLGFRDKSKLIKANVYPEINNFKNQNKPDIIVCNPPWLPFEPSPSLLDAAIYDNNSNVLKEYLNGIKTNIGDESHCEGFLIISDLAERLGLRSRSDLLDMIRDAGLEVIERIDGVPNDNKRREDKADKLHEARSKEVTSLWRLRVSTEAQ